MQTEDVAIERGGHAIQFFSHFQAENMEIGSEGNALSRHSVEAPSVLAQAADGDAVGHSITVALVR